MPETGKNGDGGEPFSSTDLLLFKHLACPDKTVAPDNVNSLLQLHPPNTKINEDRRSPSHPTDGEDGMVRGYSGSGNGGDGGDGGGEGGGDGNGGGGDGAMWAQHNGNVPKEAVPTGTLHTRHPI